MSKFKSFISLCLLTISATATAAQFSGEDLSEMIPNILEHESHQGFCKIPNVAQYGNGDWSGVLGIARGISLKEAFKIAKEHSEITFFFYMKGYQMVLPTPDGNWRTFRKGDAVFFTGEPEWDSAVGFADGYVKLQPEPMPCSTGECTSAESDN